MYTNAEEQLKFCKACERKQRQHDQSYHYEPNTVLTKWKLQKSWHYVDIMVNSLCRWSVCLKKSTWDKYLSYRLLHSYNKSVALFQAYYYLLEVRSFWCTQMKHSLEKVEIKGFLSIKVKPLVVKNVSFRREKRLSVKWKKEIIYLFQKLLKRLLGWIVKIIFLNNNDACLYFDTNINLDASLTNFPYFGILAAHQLPFLPHEY